MITFIKNLFLSKDERAVKKACKLADRRASIYRRRYFVIRDWTGKPAVLNNREIQMLKRKKIMNKKCNIVHLLNESIYFTK
jgi:hypothetical protein